MADEENSLPGALEGVRVVEFAQAMAIPMCGLLLADMGADVVKVEPPAGDAIRHTMEPIFPGESKGFAILNRGKRSLCLDVTDPGARPIIERLVAWADIVLMSMKPADLPRYGLTYTDFAAMRRSSTSSTCPSARRARSAETPATTSSSRASPA